MKEFASEKKGADASLQNDDSSTRQASSKKGKQSGDPMSMKSPAAAARAGDPSAVKGMRAVMGNAYGADRAATKRKHDSKFGEVEETAQAEHGEENAQSSPLPSSAEERLSEEQRDYIDHNGDGLSSPMEQMSWMAMVALENRDVLKDEEVVDAYLQASSAVKNPGPETGVTRAEVASAILVHVNAAYSPIVSKYGLAPSTVNVSLEQGMHSADSAVFNWRSWTIRVNADHFLAPGEQDVYQLDEASMEEIRVVIYHEVRHAEQAVRAFYLIRKQESPPGSGLPRLEDRGVDEAAGFFDLSTEVVAFLRRLHVEDDYRDSEAEQWVDNYIPTTEAGVIQAGQNQKVYSDLKNAQNHLAQLRAELAELEQDRENLSDHATIMEKLEEIRAKRQEVREAEVDAARAEYEYKEIDIEADAYDVSSLVSEGAHDEQ